MGRRPVLTAGRRRSDDGVVAQRLKPGLTKQGKPQRESADYTSASLITQKRATWRYGRMELRAKLPQLVPYKLKLKLPTYKQLMMKLNEVKKK